MKSGPSIETNRLSTRTRWRASPLLGTAYACAELDQLKSYFFLDFDESDVSDVRGEEHDVRPPAARHTVTCSRINACTHAACGCGGGVSSSGGEPPGDHERCEWGARVLDAKAFNQAHILSVVKKRNLSHHETAREKEEAAAKDAAAAEANKENATGNRQRNGCRFLCTGERSSATSGSDCSTAPAPAAAARGAPAARARRAVTAARPRWAPRRAAAAARRMAAAAAQPVQPYAALHRQLGGPERC
eukprot:5539817-Pleurochrysis_carterae.AAC.1